MTQFYMMKDGQLYSGELVVNGNLIDVYAGGESKFTQLNGMRVESLSRILLGHLIREGHAKPEQFIVVAEKNGIQVLKVIEAGPGGSEIVTFLVVGPHGVLEDFTSLEGAMAYFEELTEEPEDFSKNDFSPSGW